MKGILLAKADFAPADLDFLSDLVPADLDLPGEKFNCNSPNFSQWIKVTKHSK